MAEQADHQRSLSYWRDQALHILPLATILGFFTVVYVLFGVFDSWGLMLTQLITPGDTILPGLVLGFLAVAVVYIAFLPGLLVGQLLKKIAIAHRPYVMLGMVVATAPFWVPNGFGNLWIKALATLIAVGCSTHLFLNRAAYRKVPVPARLASCVVVLPLALWLNTAFGQIQDLVSRKGFAGGVTIEKASDTPCAGRVLWLGEKTLVVRCNSSQDGIRLMTTTDGLQFRSGRPPKPQA